MAGTKRPRKRYVPRHVNPLAYQLGMAGAQKLDVTEQVTRAEMLRGAVDTIAAGSGTAEEWQKVFSVVNILAALGDLPGAPIRGADDFISRTQDTVADVMDRVRETGSSTLYAEEVTLLRDLQSLWADVLAVVSCRELFQASERVQASYQRACRGNPPAGTRVVKGPWA
jgi:hypothetical protein